MDNIIILLLVALVSLVPEWIKRRQKPTLPPDQKPVPPRQPAPLKQPPPRPKTLDVSGLPVVPNSYEEPLEPKKTAPAAAPQTATSGPAMANPTLRQAMLWHEVLSPPVAYRQRRR